MSPSVVAEIEDRFRVLSRDEQLRVLERLVRSLREEAAGGRGGDDLTAMSGDPEIQRELRTIEAEFGRAESDGLEPEHCAAAG